MRVPKLATFFDSFRANAVAAQPAPHSSAPSLLERHLQLLLMRLQRAHLPVTFVQGTSGDICKLFQAEHLIFYTTTDNGQAIISRVRSKQQSSGHIKLPLSPQSIAGYVAMSQQVLNIADVYDEQALKQWHPQLAFLKQLDKQNNTHSQQILAAPLLLNQRLWGVLELFNHRKGTPFEDTEVAGLKRFCDALAAALARTQPTRQNEVPSARHEHAFASAPIVSSTASKYESLVSSGLLGADLLETCLKQAQQDKQPEDRLLMRVGKLRPDQIGQALGTYYGVAYEPFKAERTPAAHLLTPFKPEFLQTQAWLPLEEGPNGLVILCQDPESVIASRVVPQVFHGVSQFVYRVTTSTEFEQTLTQIYGNALADSAIDKLLANLDETPPAKTSTESSVDASAADNELVKFVNKIIADAHTRQASDIHIEPMPDNLKTGIRFRIDGSLTPYIEVPAQFRHALVTRLKIMCDLDISEHRKPQDGKIKFKKYGPLDIELRVAIIPSSSGMEDVVLRLLPCGEPIALDQLNLTPYNLERIVQTIEKPYGLFYVCGPTGAGKTTTLHSILKHLNTPSRKIWTAEDPVEITQKGLRQVQINRKAGIDFATIMRAFLRADPDIIMVGESRDKETVATGVEASLTGHVVFSTLHTNSAPESIVRLLDMGMDPFNFADALLGILAQRLAKKLCVCKEAYEPDEPELSAFVTEYSETLCHSPAWQSDPEGEADKLLNHWRTQYGQRFQFYRRVGCAACMQTGYKGRVGLHELLITDAQTKKQIQEHAPVADLFASAVASGMRTLKMDGMEKVLMGLTDLHMVRAVCMR